MSSSVLPDPAGAWTINEVCGSSARWRAAGSSCMVQFLDAAETGELAEFAGLVFGIDHRFTCLETASQIFQRVFPTAQFVLDFAVARSIHSLHIGKDTRGAQSEDFDTAGSELHQSGGGDFDLAGNAI